MVMVCLTSTMFSYINVYQCTCGFLEKLLLFPGYDDQPLGRLIVRPATKPAIYFSFPKATLLKVLADFLRRIEPMGNIPLD